MGERTPLARFAASLRRDVNAIKNALATPWTTSPVEGHISKLKMIKRTMYDRAGFKLLRARILYAQWPVDLHALCERAQFSAKISCRSGSALSENQQVFARDFGRDRLGRVRRWTTHCAAPRPGQRPSAPAWNWRRRAMSRWQRRKVSLRSGSAAETGPDRQVKSTGSDGAALSGSSTRFLRPSSQTPMSVTRFSTAIPAMTAQDRQDIIAFLNTLTDGYKLQIKRPVKSPIGEHGCAEGAEQAGDVRVLRKLTSINLFVSQPAAWSWPQVYKTV